MSTVTATAPVTRRVRAYFAPVNRSATAPVIFDAANSGTFSLDAPPAPWTDLGWCTNFVRKSETKIGAMQAGAPAMVQAQLRTAVEATVSLEFESWGKLQLALTSGSQQMNLLKTAVGATPNGSGGGPLAAIPLTPNGGSTSMQLIVEAGETSIFSVGSLVAVDVDYAGQVGFLGSGTSGAYVAPNRVAGKDTNYIRRITLNVGRVASASGGVVGLTAPLPAGVPTTGMKVSSLTGFVDREGGSYFQEWSALFVLEGAQGDRIIFHYPRLQAMQGAAEIHETLVAPLERVRLAGAFRALPVKDANDGEMVLCFRSYLPGTTQAV